MISTQNIQQIQDFSHLSRVELNGFLQEYADYRVFELYELLFKDHASVHDSRLYFLPDGEKAAILDRIFKEHLSSEKKEVFQLGKWVVIPQLKEIYHLIDQLDLLELRTIRNRNLITSAEQQELYDKKILLIGLSVGSNILHTLVRMGVGSTFTLVDYDSVDSHNLNRTQYFLRNITQKKVLASASSVVGIDPYLQLNLIDQAVNDADTEALVKNHDIIIDAFDDVESKIQLRKKAKQLRKPVVSGWDVGSGMVIIVERYDLDVDLELSLFLNNISIDEVLQQTNGLREKIDIFIKIIGREAHDERMLASVYSIGGELTGIPQHIISTSLTSAVFTQVIVDILLQKSSKSIRKHLDLNNLIYS